MSETTLLVGNFMGTKVKPGSMGKPGPGYKVDIIDDLVFSLCFLWMAMFLSNRLM